MIETLKPLLTYLKNPTLDKDENKQLDYRLGIFFKLLGLAILFGFAITPLFILLEEFGIIDMDSHKLEDIFENMNPLLILLIAGLLVPIFEELIFRAPLTLFHNPKTFKWAFYVFTLAFGFIHITNYEIDTTILILSPILVLPQLFVGICLGFLRVRFGLGWAILLHSVYNSILFSISLIGDL